MCVGYVMYVCYDMYVRVYVLYVCMLVYVSCMYFMYVGMSCGHVVYAC